MKHEYNTPGLHIIVDIHTYSIEWAPNPRYSAWQANYIPLVLLGIADVWDTNFQSWACYQLATSSGQVFLINFKIWFKFVVLLKISKVQLGDQRKNVPDITFFIHIFVSILLSVWFYILYLTCSSLPYPPPVFIPLLLFFPII